MGLEFSAGEVFEMACQIERNGARFYRKAAQTVAGGDGGVKQKLLDLAAMEDDHLATFTSMLEGLSSQERTAPVYDPDDEAVLYLQAFADTRVFDAKSDPSEKLRGGESLQEILQRAIGLEKDSITFYTGIRAVVPDKLGKDRIEDIIREEMGHIAMLAGELSAL